MVNKWVYEYLYLRGASNPTYNTMYQLDKVTDVHARVLEIAIWEPHCDTTEFLDPQASEVSQWEIILTCGLMHGILYDAVRNGLSTQIDLNRFCC